MVYNYCDIKMRELAKAKMNEYFRIDIKYCLDTLLSWHYKRVLIDIEWFDRWLHDIYGEYEKEGKSMSDMVLLHYGHDAHEFIKSVILL